MQSVFVDAVCREHEARVQEIKDREAGVVTFVISMERELVTSEMGKYFRLRVWEFVAYIWIIVQDNLLIKHNLILALSLDGPNVGTRLKLSDMHHDECAIRALR